MVTTKDADDESSQIKNSFFKNLKVYLEEYCNYSSVHGLRYLAERRTTFERIWWLAVLSISLTACAVSVRQVYLKWEQNAVIINLANKETSIFNIPFPAVTICPESKIVPSKFEKFEKRFIWRSQIMAFICNQVARWRTLEDPNFQEKICDIMHTAKPNFQVYDYNAKFRVMHKIENKTYIFTPIITDEGFCYSYNILHRDEMFNEGVLYYRNYHKHGHGSNWSIEGGYTKQASTTYPYRAYVNESSTSFRLFVSDDDIESLCEHSERGYKVLLHAPMTMPRFEKDYFKIKLNQTVAVAVKPVMISTSDSLKKYSFQTRGCYFQSEKRLKYFKVYNPTNCKLECLTNYTLRHCGCVAFFMPRVNGTRICAEAYNIDCMEEAIEKMRLDNYSKAELDATNCDCLAACSDLSYEIEVSQMNEGPYRPLVAAHLSDHLNKPHISTLTIHFKSDTFIKSERNELYGPTDFLANFGGLLGLFVGFSAVSFMEILYFSLVRIFCNKRLHGDWTGAPRI